MFSTLSCGSLHYHNLPHSKSKNRACVFWGNKVQSVKNEMRRNEQNANDSLRDLNERKAEESKIGDKKA